MYGNTKVIVNCACSSLLAVWGGGAAEEGAE